MAAFNLFDCTFVGCFSHSNRSAGIKCQHANQYVDYRRKNCKCAVCLTEKTTDWLYCQAAQLRGYK